MEISCVLYVHCPQYCPRYIDCRNTMLSCLQKFCETFFNDLSTESVERTIYYLKSVHSLCQRHLSSMPSVHCLKRETLITAISTKVCRNNCHFCLSTQSVLTPVIMLSIQFIDTLSSPLEHSLQRHLSSIPSAHSLFQRNLSPLPSVT